MLLHASASDDPDGTVVGYAWDFGDGSTSTAPTPTTQHEYQAEGTYTATLTVTDDSGATDVASRQVVAEAEPPPPVGPEWRTGASLGSNTKETRSSSSRRPCRPATGCCSSSRPPGPQTLTTPAGWTLLGTVSDGTEMRSWVLTRVAVAGTGGSQPSRMALDATSKVSLALARVQRRGCASCGARRAGRKARPRPARTPHPQRRSAGDRGPCSVYYVDKGATAHGWTLSPYAGAESAPRLAPATGFLTAVLGEQGGRRRPAPRPH